MVIRENEIYKRLRTVLTTAMEKFGISGIAVVQAQQPLPTNCHGCLIISRITVRRHGWQGTRCNVDNGKEFTVTNSFDYIDEANYQVSGYVPRKATDPLESPTAYDIVSAVVTYLETPMGDALMRQNGLQPLRIGEIRVPVITDDSNSHQFNPNFDLRFYIHQTVDMDIPILYGMKPGGPGGKGAYDPGPGGEDPERPKKYIKDGKGGIWHI